MNKVLIGLLVVIVLSGCSSNTDKEEKANVKSDNIKIELKNLVEDSASFREKGTLDKYKEVVYNNSPYEKYIDYIKKNQVAVDTGGNTEIDISDFKVVKEEDKYSVASVTEHTVIDRVGTDIDTEVKYYYIFKKSDGEWKIYDYLPTKTVSNIDDFIDNLTK